MATEEEQEQIKADAKERAKERDAETRATEQKAAIKSQEEHVEAFRQDADEAARGTQAVTVEVVTEAVGEALEEYGPYDETRPAVTTSQGENGVPYGKVLFFVEQETFDNRIKANVTRKVPHLRRATKQEMAPIRARRAEKKAALQGRV